MPFGDDGSAFRPPLGRAIGDGRTPPRPLLHRMYVACHVLRLGTEARFTALVLLHRYFAAVSSSGGSDAKRAERSDAGWAAAACLFLACKAEEEPRRLRDVINLAHMLLLASPSDHETTEKDIITLKNPPDLNQAYWDNKKQIVETEQEVLRWLSFDASVSHPHRIVTLLSERHPDCDRLIRMAFRRLNDALFHAPALRHRALEMAVAAMRLAAEELRREGDSAGFTVGDGAFLARYGVVEKAMADAERDLEEATMVLKREAAKGEASSEMLLEGIQSHSQKA